MISPGTCRSGASIAASITRPGRHGLRIRRCLYTAGKNNSKAWAWPAVGSWHGALTCQASDGWTVSPRAWYGRLPRGRLGPAKTPVAEKPESSTGLVGHISPNWNCPGSRSRPMTWSDRRRRPLEISPPGGRNRADYAAGSSPIPGAFGAFPASGGVFCRPARRNGESPITTWLSGASKVYI